MSTAAAQADPTERPPFQFSLMDMLVTVLLSGAAISLALRHDYYDLENETLATILLLGAFAGALCAVQYRRRFRSRSSLYLPPFIMMGLLLVGGPRMRNTPEWYFMVGVFYPPYFMGCIVGFGSRGHPNRVLVVVLAALSGLILSVIAIPPMVYPRSAVNETMAVSTCKALIEAQEIYARTDFDGDGVKEYANNASEMYETRPGAADLNFIDRVLVDADTTQGLPATMRSGYFIRFLDAQGSHAAGGARSYRDALGNMTSGYAFIVFPARYPRLGRRTFIVNNSGSVYSKDFGPGTINIVKSITVFDPDPSWTSTE
jgi:hypothetical protein